MRDTRIGYARVSTDDQNLDLQRDALTQAKCRDIYEEQATGKNTNRPQLGGRLKSLRGGDTLVVWRLDRLGRNLADLVRLVAELEQRKIPIRIPNQEDRNRLAGRPRIASIRSPVWKVPAIAPGCALAVTEAISSS